MPVQLLASVVIECNFYFLIMPGINIRTSLCVQSVEMQMKWSTSVLEYLNM